MSWPTARIASLLSDLTFRPDQDPGSNPASGSTVVTASALWGLECGTPSGVAESSTSRPFQRQYPAELRERAVGQVVETATQRVSATER